MEFEVVEVKVPRGFLCCGNLLMIGNSEGGDKVHGAVRGSDGKPWLLVSRPEPIKPDWNPPKLKRGWVTWDLDGWYWWEKRPEYHDVDLWVYPPTDRAFEKEKIGSVISKILGFPDCTGFDARNCIWEVGE